MLCCMLELPRKHLLLIYQPSAGLSVPMALWVQRHINQGQPLKKNPSWSPSGDTRGLLKPLTSDLYVIKIDGY